MSTTTKLTLFDDEEEVLEDLPINQKFSDRFQYNEKRKELEKL
jgi:hypothetical protein